jgi:hypothetical protein
MAKYDGYIFSGVEPTCWPCCTTGPRAFGGKEKAIFSGKFEVGLNSETNGNVVVADLMKAAYPNITDQARNKQVIILDVHKKRVKGGYWARWVWAMAGGNVTYRIQKQLFDIGAVTWNPDLNDPSYYSGTDSDTKSPLGGIWWSSSSDYTNKKVKVFSSAPKHAGKLVKELSWTMFKEAYMIPGSNVNSDDQYNALKWNQTELDALARTSNSWMGANAIDKAYWNHDGSYTASGVANAFGPNTVGGDFNSVQLSPLGSTQQLTMKQLSHLPNKAESVSGSYSWNGKGRWIHYSQDNSNNGSTTSGSSFIPSGKVSFAVNTVISGYSKPFILVETPYQVLYGIDFSYGEDLTPYLYTAKQIQNYIIDGTALPAITVPSSFIEKFSEDVVSNLKNLTV